MISGNKKLFYAILSAVLIYVFFFILTQSKFFSAKIIKTLVNNSNGPVQIVDIKFSDHVFDFPKFFQMSDVMLVLVDRSNLQWNVSLDSVSLNCEKCFQKERPEGSLIVKNMSLRNSTGVNTSGIFLSAKSLLKDHRPWKSQGDVQIDHIDFYGIVLDDLRTYVMSNKDETLFKDIWARISRGIIKGEVVLEPSKNFSYNANMRFVDFDVDGLGKKAQGIKANIGGKFDGFLDISGDQTRINKISGRMTSIENAKVHSRLIGYLMSYVPGSAIAQQLDELIRTKQFINLEDFQITFSNVSRSVLLTSTKMMSKENALDVNIDININLGTDIIKLMQLLKGW